MSSSIRRLNYFANPAPAARRIFPYIVILQSELSAEGDHRLAAPLVLAPPPGKAGLRVAPAVEIAGTSYLVLTPRVTPVRLSALRTSLGSLDRWHDEIGRALDWIFFGV